MSAKFIYNLSDEAPDLQKQIGCMNGIFQLFDRHHFLGGDRRIFGQNHKRLLSGQSGRHGIEPKRELQNTEIYRKAMKEKHRPSTESSRTSFSSSSCSSSLSSLECNRSFQVEPPVFVKTIIPETRAWGSTISQKSASLQSSRLSVDLRNVVKDSIYREPRGLSVKTVSKGKSEGQTLKYIDSPRPLQHSKSANPRSSCGKESFQPLHNFQEGSCKPSEAKHGSIKSPVRDTRRFSCDGRESRDTLKSTIKLKELPRLSLDSRATFIRGSIAEIKANKVLSSLDRGNSNDILNRQESGGCHGGPSSVVAKLMGLETFPQPISTNDPFSVSSRTLENKRDLISGSPRNSGKESMSPRLRNADADKKPMASLKFPLETDPWEQADGSRGSQMAASKSHVTLARSQNSSISICGEIEKRSAQLEFKNPGNDLRTPKQKLQTMQKTKNELKTRDRASNLSRRTSSNSILDQTSKSRIEHDPQDSCASSAITKGTSSPKRSHSPIEIMKPTKFIQKPIHVTSSVSPITNLSSLSKHTAKDLSPRTNYLREHSNQLLQPNKKNIGAKLSRLTQSTNNTHSLTKESNNTSKGSGSMNPRQQHKKLGFERQSRPMTPSSDSNRTGKQPSRQLTESGSLHRKPKTKLSDDEYSDISSEVRDFSHQGDSISVFSESNMSLGSQNDEEISSTDKFNKISDSSIQQSHRKQNNPVVWSRPIAKPAVPSSEQPSPVSVLDATFCSDELPSPIKKISIDFKDDEAVNSGEMQWNNAEANPSFSSSNSTPNFLHDHNSMENMNPLIQNPKQIFSAHGGPIHDEIAPFYKSSNPEHGYISEVLLASGLLNDFESHFMTINLLPNSYPINPNLFLAMEQSKARTRHVNEPLTDKKMSERQLKIQRKLMFDVTNEVLNCKLQLEGSSKKWLSPHLLARQGQKGHQLLQELCSEVDRMQSNKTSCNLDEEDDSLRSILWADLMHQSMHWTECRREIPGLVLDVERLIFKDLINEVVTTETISPRGQPAGHCRQLFLKHNFSNLSETKFSSLPSMTFKSEFYLI